MSEVPLSALELVGAHGILGHGDPSCVSIKEATRRALEAKREFEARPETVAKRKRDAEADQRIAAAKAAKEDNQAHYLDGVAQD